MRKNLLILCTLLFSISTIAQTPCSGGSAGGYPCDGITLQSYISASTMGAAEGQDSWGWTDVDGNGNEYAIVALDNGTAFVNITNPTSPAYLGRLNTHTGSSLWRDVKVYNNHAYIVSDSNGNHGMQVFDLTRLRGLTGSPVVNFTEDGWMTWGSGNGRGRAHNIIINETNGFAYILGVSPYNSGGPIFVRLDGNNDGDPTDPVEVAAYSSAGYCHDAQVIMYDGPDPDHQGKELLIGSFSSSDFVRILDVTNKNNVTQIGQIAYQDKYYTHQGWFTEDKRFFIVGDEVDEENVGFNTRTLVFDLQDLDNPVLHYTHYGTTPAIDHNGYVRGNRFYLANYAAGMRVFKIDGLYDSPPTMTEVDFFDMYPNSNTASFNGTWNVYPFFESGNLVVSGFGNANVNGDGGLFILKDPNYDNQAPNIVCQPYTAVLDAATGTVTVNPLDVDGGSTDNIGITSRTLTGQTTFTCDDIGDHTVTYTIEDDYGFTATCTTIITVVPETTVYQGGNSWSNGVPDIGSNAKISTNDYDTSAAGNSSFSACTCEVDANRTLTVGAGDHIEIEKDITVNGTLTVKHEGSVVQTDPNANVNKGVGGVINVELTTPVLQTRDFMVMGSPMTAETRNGVFTNAFLVLNHTPSNFEPHPAVSAGATNFLDSNGDLWNAYSGSINVGEGYIVRPQSGYNDPANTTYNMTFTQGTLNNGSVTRSTVFRDLAVNPHGTPNAYANPYPSAISATEFIQHNALVNEVYFWEHLTPPSVLVPGQSIKFDMDDISMFNLSGGTKAANDTSVTEDTKPNGIISTAQGFAIKAFGNGSVEFTNDMRETTGNTTLRAPQPAQQGVNRIWLDVKNAEFEVNSSTLIAFNSLATPGMDAGYDSNRLGTVISLYSYLLDEDKELGIQTREAFADRMKITLGFDSKIEAKTSFEISIAAMDGEQIPSATVYLFDHVENTLTNLSQENYVFASGDGNKKERFTLLFENENILGPNDSLLESIMVYPNPADDLVSIVSPNTNLTNIDVYDLRGRLITEKLDDEIKFITLNVSHLKTGVYFIRIETENGNITKKLIKN